MIKINSLPIGSVVFIKKTHYGMTINEITYGYLPEGAKGKVEEHTLDGRAVIHFPGHGVHTGNELWLNEHVAVAPESALLARFAEMVEATNFSDDRALLHLLRSCEGKFAYDADDNIFHKQFRQQDVAGDANIDMAIWWLMRNSDVFWSVFSDMKRGDEYVQPNLC